MTFAITQGNLLRASAYHHADSIEFVELRSQMTLQNSHEIHLSYVDAPSFATAIYLMPSYRPLFFLSLGVYVIHGQQ